MTWEPRPTPEVTPETERFWSAAADGRFVLPECRDCGLVFYYPRSHCPDCLGDDLEWFDASGRGEVYSYSILERIEGWPEEHLPVVTAFVELEEGPRVMTDLVDCDPDAVSVGTSVEAEFVPTEDDDVAVPVFVPTE